MTAVSVINEALFGAVCPSAEYSETSQSYMEQTGTLPRSGKAEACPFWSGMQYLMESGTEWSSR